MAVVQVSRAGSPLTAGADGCVLCTAQGGTGDSTNIADRGQLSGYALLQIANVGGSTPTVTIAINGSMDGTNFYPVQYADSATPGTLVITTFAMTTTGTANKLITSTIPWRFLKITLSANTNETVTATLWAN